RRNRRRPVGNRRSRSRRIRARSHVPRGRYTGVVSQLALELARVDLDVVEPTVEATIVVDARPDLVVELKHESGRFLENWSRLLFPPWKEVDRQARASLGAGTEALSLELTLRTRTARGDSVTVVDEQRHSPGVVPLEIDSFPVTVELHCGDRVVGRKDVLERGRTIEFVLRNDDVM